MRHSQYLVLALALVACGSKDKDKGGDKGKSGDKGGDDKGGGASGAEAKLMLKKITDAAKEESVVNAALPSGKVGPVPAEPCCSKPDKKCKPDAALWSDPTWKKLGGFSIDEAFAFQYSYESDGKSFTAKAIGCGGAKTYTASGTMSAGKLQVDFSEE
jgi:hypothetical protein